MNRRYHLVLILLSKVDSNLESQVEYWFINPYVYSD